jgi:hypothetical protein
MDLKRLFRTAMHYDYPPPGLSEDLAAYRQRVIAHVAAQDLAAAFELRLEKDQSDWTPQEVQAYEGFLRSCPGPRTTPGFADVMVLADQGPWAPTTDELMGITDRGLAGVMERRRADPTWVSPIYISVLLHSGVLLTTVTTRDDRLAVLKFLTSASPAFGFLMVFDAFVHTVDRVTQKASKQDALLAQVGTRELRLVRQRPYRVTGGVVVFDDPPPADLRPSDHPHDFQDPYADLFAMGPAQGRVS